MRGDPSKPWSLAKTPWFVNPDDPAAAPRLLPWEDGIDEFREILESPVPWKYIEDGYVLYDGPSAFDGEPIIVVATLASENVKTGGMVQTWVLRKDMSPQEAIDTGGDYSICGDCVHRGDPVPEGERRRRPRRLITPKEAARGVGIASGPPTRKGFVYPVREGRTCYVVAAQAPTSVWKAFHRKVYPKLAEGQLPLLAWGRLVRIGTYGDPAAVPARIWETLAWHSVGWTGYTHQWRMPEAQRLRRILMASVDSDLERREARSTGWRTFRILKGEEQLVAGYEMECRAGGIQEEDEEVHCDACCLCQGTILGPRGKRKLHPGAKGIAITVHPRWQLLFDVKKLEIRGHRWGTPEQYRDRAKKARKARAKAKAAGKKFVPSDPPKRKNEVVIADKVPGAVVKKLKAFAKKALRADDVHEYVETHRDGFPGYTQPYIDDWSRIMEEAKKKRRKKNPSSPRAARGRCEQCGSLRTVHRTPLGTYCDVCYQEVVGYAEPSTYRKLKTRGDPLMTRKPRHRGFAPGYSETSYEGTRRRRNLPVRSNPLLAIVGNPATERSYRGFRYFLSREGGGVYAVVPELRFKTILHRGPDATLEAEFEVHDRIDEEVGGVLELASGENPPKKLGEVIREVVRDHDGQKAGRVADFLRFRHGMNYDQTYGLFRELTGISKPDFESLMYEADLGYSNPPTDLEKRVEQMLRYWRIRGAYAWVSRPGDYGEVGYSELAMHARIAGRPVVQYALFSTDDRLPFVTYALVMTKDGVVTEGFPHEVLPPEVIRSLPGDYSSPRIPPTHSHRGGHWPISRGNPPPPRSVHPLAYKMRARYLGDVGAGHGAADYWRGQAAALFTDNPGENRCVPELAFEMRDRYRGDMEEGHDAADYWRGQAAALFTDGPGCGLRGWIDDELPVPREVAGGVVSGSVESGRKERRRPGKKAKKVKKKTNPQDRKKKRPKAKKVGLEEARKYRGFEEAIEAYERFHGTKPSEMTIYFIEDGQDAERIDNVHTALHRTLETPYVVPWKSNKKGSLWLHEHPKGEGAPLEVLDPFTGTTKKIAGDYVVDDWWYS